MGFGDQVFVAVLLRAQATGDDDLAVFGDRLTDCVERLLDRGVDKPACIDDHQIGIAVARAGCIAFGAQLRDDQF